MKTLNGLMLTLVATFTLAGCGGGGDGQARWTGDRAKRTGVDLPWDSQV